MDFEPDDDEEAELPPEMISFLGRRLDIFFSLRFFLHFTVRGRTEDIVTPRYRDRHGPLPT
jgi:hypothetical protein